MPSNDLQIAIVHQSADICNILYGAVSQLGHSVCLHASTGRALIDAAGTHNLDLIIVQETLPDMDGLQAVQEFCGGEDIPTIVVLDARNGRLLEQEGAKNVLGVLQEPVRSSDLIPVIPLVMQRFEKLQELLRYQQDLQAELNDLSSS